MCPQSSIYKIPVAAAGSIAIVARPRGDDWLDDELRHLAAHGIDILVSLLAAEEEAALGLDREAELCAAHRVEFVAFPVDDFSVPHDTAAFIRLVQQLAEAVRNGQSVAVHCRQGIGRSGLLTIALVIALGEDFENAVRIVSDARGLRVPETRDQHDWLDQHRHDLAAEGRRQKEKGKRQKFQAREF